jgi:hypothetical protein
VTRYIQQLPSVDWKPRPFPDICARRSAQVMEASSTAFLLIPRLHTNDEELKVAVRNRAHAAVRAVPCKGGLILEKPAMPNTLVAAVENLLRAR